MFTATATSITAFLLLLSITILISVYLFLIWHFNYWRKLGIKTAQSYAIVGSYPSPFTKKRNVAYDIDDIYRKFKRTEHFVGAFSCRKPELLLLSPEHVRRVLVNDFRCFHDNDFSKLKNKNVDLLLANNPFALTGDEWKLRRAEVTPGLTVNRINAVYPVTLKVCHDFIEHIKVEQKMASASFGLNAKELCLRYTTEVVSDCVLGISARSFSANPTPIARMVTQIFNNTFSFIFYRILLDLVPGLQRFYTVPLLNKEAECFFVNLINNAIDLRRRESSSAAGQRVDFLNYMLQLQQKKQFDNTELASHTMTFLIDGFETTALVLTHALLLLARHPEAQARLLSEAGRDALDLDKLSELPYLDACLNETLRIFPPQIVARKICTEPCEFVNADGIKLQLQPGDTVVIPSWSIHHDPDIYAEPEQFKPERFLDADGDAGAGAGLRKYRDAGAFLGFGDGPRMCPGMRFAQTQLKAALVAIVRNFHVKVNSKTRGDNRLDDSYFLSTLKHGVWLEFEERANY